MTSVGDLLRGLGANCTPDSVAGIPQDVVPAAYCGKSNLRLMGMTEVMAEYPPLEGGEYTSEHAVREARQLALDELFRVPQAGHSLAIDHFFPEEFVDELSRREVFNKHLFRPNTYLHKWWARRCGSTFRAILKQFVPGSERRDYYAAGGLEGRTVLDPMMGGAQFFMRPFGWERASLGQTLTLSRSCRLGPH